MDLGAYVQIEDLDKIAKENGIVVPRLRGYRLMKTEEPVDLHEVTERIEVEECEFLIESSWIPNSYTSIFNDTTRRNKKRYMTYHYEVTEGGHSHIVYDSVRWDRIHGRHRKDLKFAIKRSNQRFIEQYEMFNKYCGQDDVLYIHARIGGGNWKYYGGEELKTQHWFLEHVDDACDSTYCDIYAKLKS